MLKTLGSQMRSLTDKQVQEIRIKYRTTQVRQKDLAQEYHCDISTICLWLNPNPAKRLQKFKYVRSKMNICDCGILYKQHPRCVNCSQLLHNECDCRKSGVIYFSQDINNFL